MNSSRIAKSTFFNLLRGLSIVFAAVAAFLMFGATTARAGCGVPGNQLQGNSFKPAAFETAPAADPEPRAGHASVVGFWHVKLLYPDGSLYFQSIVQYHNDGMELESADLPVLGGNFCMGVWKQEGTTIKIYHIAWLYQSGNPSSYAVFTQTNTLSHDGDSYHGQFDIKEYDLSGGFLGEIQGTTTARRIDFHHPFSLF